jgi:dTDP-glucose 4,6-dehydratase
LVDEGQAGEVYNIGSGIRTSNLELTEMLLSMVGVDRSHVDHVEDRLGHDYRYAVDSSKMRALGWTPRHNLIDGLDATVDWYRRNESWWLPLRGRE